MSPDEAENPDPASGPARAVPVHALDEVRTRMLELVKRTAPRWLSPHAEDIVQTAIVRVMERHGTSGGDLDVSASYLLKAAYNATVDEIRKRYRSPEMVPHDTAPFDRAEAPAPGPERAAEAVEIDKGIRACLASLAPPRRRAVILYLLGYSLAEASEALGWTLKRSEHLIYRGLDDMRRCLAAKGLEP